MYAFLSASLLVPALYPDTLGGETPLYVSNFLLIAGLLTLILKASEFHVNWDRICQASGYFLLTLLLSLPFAFWISGPSEGMQSLLRFLLIVQPFFAYAWVRGFRCIQTPRQIQSLVKTLACLGVLSALYGVADFYYPLPIPHPFADQYIYLDFKHIRRAQGIFYEASSFGNMCAFLLSLALCLLFSGQKRLALFYRLLLAVAGGVFTIAVFLSYSRGSWLAVMVAVPVFLVLQGQLRIRAFLTLGVMVGGFIWLVYQFSEDIVANFFSWRLGTLADFWTDPNSATSGRWENWATLLEFFAERPWFLLFGIGYKTIPHTEVFGRSVVADNGYMSFLFEAGIPGLAAFFWLSFAMMKTMAECRKTNLPACRMYATFLLAFWCGELVQMLTGDIFTYWRNLTVIFVLIASVQTLAETHRQNPMHPDFV
jgi:O-antigen ligase